MLSVLNRFVVIALFVGVFCHLPNDALANQWASQSIGGPSLAPLEDAGVPPDQTETFTPYIQALSKECGRIGGEVSNLDLRGILQAELNGDSKGDFILSPILVNCSVRSQFRSEATRGFPFRYGYRLNLILSGSDKYQLIDTGHEVLGLDIWKLEEKQYIIIYNRTDYVAMDFSDGKLIPVCGSAPSIKRDFIGIYKKSCGDYLTFGEMTPKSPILSSLKATFLNKKLRIPRCADNNSLEGKYFKGGFDPELFLYYHIDCMNIDLIKSEMEYINKQSRMLVDWEKKKLNYMHSSYFGCDFNGTFKLSYTNYRSTKSSHEFWIPFVREFERCTNDLHYLYAQHEFTYRSVRPNE